MAKRAIDLSQLSPNEKLQLIGELWDSLDERDVPMTVDQKRELDSRLERLEREGVRGRTFDEIETRLRNR